MTRIAVLMAALLCQPAGVAAVQDSGAERAYLRAVARYFQVPEGEISILAHWGLPSDEIPVALFVARRAGVSPEALVALRESGQTWIGLAARYNIGANVLHVPLRDAASAGALVAVYERYRETPYDQWAALRLEEREIIALVNVRVLSDALGVAPDDIARRTGSTRTFAELYAQLLR